MKKTNCWEHFKCGRQPGGEKERELGTCPAARAISLNGTNNGVNGGRCCWAVAGTMCKGQVQGTYAQKLGNCLKCEFFDAVRKEEGGQLVPTREILSKLKSNVK